MMFLFVISDTLIKEVKNNAVDQTYTARCMDITCFLFTAYIENLKKKRAGAMMDLSSDGAESTISVLWIDSN